MGFPITMALTTNLWNVYMNRARKSRGLGVGSVILTPIRGLIEQCSLLIFKQPTMLWNGALLLALHNYNY